MYRLLIVTFTIMTFFVSGCYYDSEENLYPNSNCNISNISFSSDIQPILNNHCMACHNAVANLGNVTLEGHSAISIYAKNGSLVGSVKHLSGFSPMPKGSSKISDCSILKIESWVKAGSPNN